MRKLSCAAVLFDLDGVLVKSRPVVERQWTRWAREHGLDAAEVVHLAHGRPTVETVRTVAPHLDAAREAQIVEQREIEDHEGVQVFAGAADLLAAVPLDRLAVVTSGSRALATSRLRGVGLPAPRTMITASEIVRGKPDPEPYLRAAAALHFAPHDCVVIEDSPAGVRAGKAAGMRVIAVATTYPADELSEADVRLKRLSDLRIAVANLPGRQAVRLELLVPGPSG